MGQTTLNEPHASAAIDRLDRDDPLRDWRNRFHLPDGIIYLDGNSLGPLPRAVAARVRHVVEAEWGQDLIRGWTARGWIDMPEAIGARIARLIGAPPRSVTVADSTSVNLFKLLAAALKLRPGRRVILTEEENFPTDVYIAEGLAALVDRGVRVLRVPPEALEAALDDTVAVLMLTEVDYRSGRRHDMARLTRMAHERDALTLFDLAHSVGAFPVDVADAGVDFAVGCGYKYLNGGPGAPAFLYVKEVLLEAVEPALSGWMGHAVPFAFEPSYRAAAGIGRMRVGTPPVIALAALDAALDVFADVDLAVLRAKAVRLSELFVAEVEARCPQLVLASPRNPDERGNHVAFRFADGYAVVQALIARGVIGDFRAPDLMRFGFAPLYLRYRDVVDAAAVLQEIIGNRDFDRPEFRLRAKVT